MVNSEIMVNPEIMVNSGIKPLDVESRRTLSARSMLGVVIFGPDKASLGSANLQLTEYIESIAIR
jgi:hypothetical protein